MRRILLTTCFVLLAACTAWGQRVRIQDQPTGPADRPLGDIVVSMSVLDN